MAGCGTGKVVVTIGVAVMAPVPMYGWNYAQAVAHLFPTLERTCVPQNSVKTRM